MARLLSYVCEQYFAGRSAELNQALIAAEVFNRAETFDGTRDSIARVELHRLRKKLKQYYETEGQGHSVQIEIPPGSYAPVFRYMPEPAQATGVSGDGIQPAAAHPTIEIFEPETLQAAPSTVVVEPTPSRQKFGRAKWWIALAGLVLLLVAARYGLTYREAHANRLAPAAISPDSPPLSGALKEPVRLLCGYDGPAHIGRLGRVWSADGFFHGGRSWPTRAGFIRRTSDPSIFRTARTGEFSYDIPVAPGFYELHLYFVETEYGEELGGGENSRTFTIRLNGETLIQTFDPLSDAGGPRIADERVFRDVQPARDGRVHISFESQRGEPLLNAIELLPGTPHRQLPIRIAAQVNPYTDHLGQIWAPDDYYMGGQTVGGKPPVSGTDDATLFETERAGHFTYAIPVDTSGTYEANLYFAETYFGPGASGIGGIGSRLFNVMCNGTMLLDHFDIFREVGTAHALEKTFHGLKPTAQGKLNFTFEPIANYASVFGIEVLDESR
jgi:hypothetical protein